MPKELSQATEAGYLTTGQAATYLSLSRKSLEAWRLKLAGPRYVKLPGGLRASVRYRRSDLDAWMAGHIVGAGGGEGGGAQ